jgi:hypothetical protein
MDNLTFNMKVAVDLALRDARAKSLDENEYRIRDVAPLDVDIYLSELGFDVDDTDYDGVCDSVYFTYSKDDLCIVLEWNGWTGYVGVMGYNVENYYGNSDC